MLYQSSLERYSLALVLGLLGCSADPGAELDSAVTQQEVATALVQQYYTVTPDMRRCVSPLCGGYWLKAVNQRKTTCADGSVADSCYVADIDYKLLGGDPQITAPVVVVQGRLSLIEYGSFGKLGHLTALDAWGAATEVPPMGRYYRLADTGIVCVTSPCFNITAELVNLGVTTTLSGYDLGKAQATPEQLAEAKQAIADARLLASGYTQLVPSPTPTYGRELVATQFFLPARDICYSDHDCARTEVCNASSVCLPPPGCGSPAACPTVCTGYCIPLVANCMSAADCPTGERCDTERCLPPPGCKPGDVCPAVCGGVCTLQ